MESDLRRRLLNALSSSSGDDRSEDTVVVGREDLKECFEWLRALEASPKTESRALVELLILGGEAAVQNGLIDQARELVEMFFEHGVARDQFYCRGLFLRAQLIGLQKTNGKDGSVKSTALESCEHILRVVEICSEKPSYNFLLYNASVHLWHAIRPLLRQGLRAASIQSLSAITAALTAANDPALAWRARLSLTLALAHEEVGNSNEALAEIKKAVDLFKRALDVQAGAPERAQVEESLKEANQLMVHIGRQASIANAKTAKTSGDIMPTLQCIQSKIITGPVEAISKELDECLELVNLGKATATSQISSVVAIGQQALANESYTLATKCIALLHDIDQRSSQKTALEAVSVEVFHAEWLVECPHSSFDVLNGKSPEQAQNDPGIDQSATPAQIKRQKDAIQVAKRIQAMKMIERAITLCTRVGKPSALEKCCLVAWNLGLPLLQPALRKHVYKVFQIAALALEEIDSPMADLRSHLHSELAKCEVADDFLSKASVQVDKALKLTAISADQNAGEEPLLNKFLKPMKAKLRLKSNIYGEPETNYDQAILLVEQSKDAREVYLKATLLQRATSLLEKSSESSESLTPKQQGTGDHVGSAKQVIVLWAEIASLAWESKLIDISQLAAKRVVDLSAQFSALCKSRPPSAALTEEPKATKADPKADAKKKKAEKGGAPAANSAVKAEAGATTMDADAKQVGILVCEMHLLLAELYAEHVSRLDAHEMAPLVANLSCKALGLRVPGVVPSSLCSADGGEVSEKIPADLDESKRVNITDIHVLEQVPWEFEDEQPFDERLVEYKHTVIKHIVHALETGHSLGESWLAENAATYLWNLHVHMFTGPLQRLEFIMPALVTGLACAHKCLCAVPIKSRQAPLFACVTAALAQAIEALYGVQLQEPNLSDGVLSAEDQNALGGADMLGRAVEVCRLGLDGLEGVVEYTKDILATLHRVQRKRKQVEPLLPGVENVIANGFSTVELLRLEPTLVPAEEKRTLLTNAVKALEDQRDKLRGVAANRSSLLEVDARLGREALDLGDLLSAGKCALQVMTQHSEDVGARAENGRPPSQLRWFSIAQVLLGRITAIESDGIIFDKTSRDQVACKAISHFCKAGQFGVQSEVARLVLDAARELWNVAVRLIDAKVTRAMIFEPLDTVFQQLEEMAVAEDPELLLSISIALFECYKDKRDWLGGLRVVERAFKVVPPQHQKRLWEARVVFSSKLNRDVAAGLHSMKGTNPTLQAKAWATLARNSSRQEDQLRAYGNAVQVLKDSFERGEYLVEFAEWLHANHFPRDDVTQCLVAAADLVLDVQAALDKAKEAALEESSQQSRPGSPMSASSGRSRISKAASQRSKKSSVRSIGGRSKRSQRSTGRTAIKDREVGDPCPDAPQRLELGHVLWLVQILTMLARSVTHSTTRSDMALVAHEQLMSAWASFILARRREILQLAQSSAPVTLSEILDACNDDALLKDKQLVAHIGTIKRLPETLHYLIELGELLQECGQHVAATTCSATILLISGCTRDSAFESLARLKIIRAVLELNLGTLADAQFAKLNLTMNEGDRAKLAVSVDQILSAREQQLAPPLPPPQALEAAIAPTKRKTLEKLKLRQVWTLCASEMIALGYVVQAKRMLRESDLHNTAFEDHENSVRGHFAACGVALLEGKEDYALDRVSLALTSLRACGGGNAIEWLRGIEMLVKSLERLRRSSEAQSILQAAMEAFEVKLDKQGSQKDLDLQVAASLIETMLAERLLVGVVERAGAGGSWKEELRVFESHVRRSQDRILIATKPYCASIATIEVLWRNARLWKSVYQCPSLGCLRQQAFENIADGLLRASRCAETMLQIVLPTSRDLLGAELCNSLSLPVQRLVGEIRAELGTLELHHSLVVSPPRSLLEQQNELESFDKLDPVRRWLQETEPKPALANEALRPNAAMRAWGHMTSAYAHLSGAPALQARAMLAAGTGLSRVACQPEDVPPGTDMGQVAHLAVNALQQAVSKALQLGLLDIVEQASHEIILSSLEETWTCQEALLLFQSAKAARWTRNLLTHGGASDRRSKLALFLRLQAHIVQGLADPSRIPSVPSFREAWPLQVCDEYLKQSVAMQRTSCNTPVKDILSMIPSNLVLLSLSLSTDGTTIFSTAVYQGGPNRVWKSPLGANDSNLIVELGSQMNGLRKRLPSFLLGHEHHAEDFERRADESEDPIQKQLDMIINDLARVFAPIVERTLQGFNVGESESSPRMSEKDLVILCDHELASLPLESLFFDTSLGFRSVSRDLSIHVLSHRLKDNISEKQAETPAPAGKKPAPATTAEPALPSTLALRPAKVCAIVDPRAHEPSLQETFALIKQSDWDSLVGARNGVPSRGLWQRVVSGQGRAESHQFVYCGLGPMFAECECQALTCLDLKKCKVAVLIDGAFNDESFRAFSSRTSACLSDCAALENAHETACLLSICGVNTVVVNLWPTSIHSNKRFMQQVLEPSLKDRTKSFALQIRTFASENQQLRSRVLLNAVAYGLPL